VSGKCAGGLQCLKTCLPCKTVGDRGLPCVFPFKYEDSYGNWTYNTCTTKDSDGGQPWCATEVDESGYVVDNAWGDCLDGCPGTRVECDDKYFSIEEGKCIDVSVPGAIPNWKGAPAVRLEDPETKLYDAPVCQKKGGAVRLYDNTCRCVRGETALDYDLQGKPRGNCTGLEDDASDNLDKVWCFLENIRDPGLPQSGCYSDVQWSERDGRYWSSLACTQSPNVESGESRPRSKSPGYRPLSHRTQSSTSTNKSKSPSSTTTNRDSSSSSSGNAGTHTSTSPSSSDDEIEEVPRTDIEVVEDQYDYYTDVEPETSTTGTTGTTKEDKDTFLFNPGEISEAGGFGGISFNEDVNESNLFDVLELLDL